MTEGVGYARDLRSEALTLLQSADRFHVGTYRFSIRFSTMTDTDLIEQSFAIAWSFLEKSGELGGDPNWSTNFLLDEIICRLKCGERRRLVLSNSAIDAYRHRPVRLVS